MKRVLIYTVVCLLSCTHDGRHTDHIQIDENCSFFLSNIESTIDHLENLDVTAPDKLNKARRELYVYHANCVREFNFQDDSARLRIVNQIAVYRKEFDKALALFYKGRFLIDEEQYENALEYFHEAERIAISIGNHHLLGCIYLRSADMFNDLFLNTTSLRYGEKAKASFIEAGDAMMANRAYGNMGIVHLEMRDYEQANLYYLETKLNALKSGDLCYFRYVTGWYLWNYMFNDMTLKTERLYMDLEEVFDNVPETFTETLALISILDQYGQGKRATWYLDSLSGHGQNVLEDLLYYKVSADVHYGSGDFSTASSNYRKYIEAYNSSDFFNNRSHLVALEGRYDNLRYKFAAEKEKQRKKRITFYSFCSLCILSFVILLMYKNNRRRKRELESRLSVIQELGKSNQTLIEKLNVQKDGELDIKKKLEAQLNYQKELVNLYSYYGERPQVFMKKLESLLKYNAFDPKSYISLRHIINIYYNNILDNLQASHPELRNDDLLFCGLTLAGFGPHEICIIMDYKSMDVVYTKKYRLKQKLRLDKSTSLEKYLASLQLP